MQSAGGIDRARETIRGLTIGFWGADHRVGSIQFWQKNLPNMLTIENYRLQWLFDRTKGFHSAELHLQLLI